MAAEPLAAAPQAAKASAAERGGDGLGAADGRSGASNRPRVALVLSGGSARGLAHIGVIRELERAGIPIDMVLGTSMGALVGGLYAAGYSPDAMEALVAGLDWSAVFSDARGDAGRSYRRSLRRSYPLRIDFNAEGFHLRRGFLEGQNILTLLTSLTLHALPERDFDALPVPFRAVAADILTGERIVLRGGSLAEALRSSMSIPGLFRPYELGGRSLVDGGIVDNLPVGLAREMGADIVIAVESRGSLAASDQRLESAVDISRQTLGLYIEANMARSRGGADLLIRPDLSGFSSMSYRSARAIVERGAAGARSAEAEIRALAARVAKERPLPAPDGQANRAAMRRPPLLQGLVIEAPTQADEAKAREAFAGLVGARLEDRALKAAIDRLYALGDYALVKFDLLPGAGGSGETAAALGSLRLEANEEADNELLFGLEYRGLAGADAETSLSLRSGLHLGGLTGVGSALVAEAALFGDEGLRLEYFQPFGPCFLSPFARYGASESRSRAPSGDPSAPGFRSRTRTFAFGGRLGLALGPRAVLSLGWSYEAVDGTAILDGGPAGGLVWSEGKRRGGLTLSVAADRRSAAVLPERGFAWLASARWSDPALGGEVSSAGLSLGATAALPLARRLTLELTGLAAGDLSWLAPTGGGMPRSERHSLGGIFLGMGPDAGRGTGDAVLGLGAEARWRGGRLGTVVPADLFFLARLAGGAVFEAGRGPDPRLLAEGGLGAALRVGRGFALRAVAGLGLGSAALPSPFLSVGIGTLGGPGPTERWPSAR
ncbi:MAG: patatin-like phospholipase family protein [Spirochaetaceae bacterium]|nr:patatin-like phospholipase family protein [Spirochaetaceae bacterium]